MTGTELTPSKKRVEALRGEVWDTCLMVRFPDIEAFIGLAADPDYQAKAPALREAALERTLWMVTQPPTS